MLTREFHAGVQHIDRVDYGVINAVYAVRLDNGLDCFVKVAPAERGHNQLRQEIWAFEQCRRVGAPTPEVLVFAPDSGAFPEPYHVTRRIPGENGQQAHLTDEQRDAVFRQLGAYLARIHTIAVEGFGRLQPDHDRFKGDQRTLWQNITAVLDGNWWRSQLLASGLATEAELRALRRLFEANRSLFNTERACLAWADGGLKNLIVEGAAVMGLVDMENVVAAEPVNDFDALHYETEADLAAVKAGYGTPALFDATFERKLRLYQLLFAFPTLAEHQRRGNAAGIAAVQARIRRLRTSLGA